MEFESSEIANRSLKTPELEEQLPVQQTGLGTTGSEQKYQQKESYREGVPRNQKGYRNAGSEGVF